MSQNHPIALITGATSGIGLAVARDLARDHNLILLARSVNDLEELALALEEESQTAVLICPVDLTDDTALARLVSRIDIESLDVLVHSAGVGSSLSTVAGGLAAAAAAWARTPSASARAPGSSQTTCGSAADSSSTAPPTAG